MLAVLVGLRLTSAPGEGGLGLSLSQYALIAPPAILVAGLFVAVVSRTAFESGLNTGMLFRPSFGLAGSWLVSAVVAVGYIIWMALEFRVSSEILASALDAAGVDVGIEIPIVVLAVIVGVLSYVGLRRFATRIVQPVLIWISVGLFGIAVLWLAQRGLVLSTDRAPGGMLLVAAQQIVVYTVVFLPLAADTSRFAGRSNYAISATGVAFMFTLGGSLTFGAVLGAAATAPTVEGLAKTVLASGTAVMAAGIIGWVLAAEAAQPYGFLYSAANATSSVFLRRPPRILGLFMVAAAGLMAHVFNEAQLFPVADVAAFVLAPAFVVVVVDYFLVRKKRYLVDEMYDRSGEYGGVNLIGFFAYVVGLFVGYVIDPLGPEVFLRGVEVALPFAGSWSDTVPAVLVSMVATAVAYWSIGRLRIAQTDVVSKVRL